MTALPMDHAERELARGSTPASRRGRWLVEASAGTGKTSVLIERALAYVRHGERRLSELAIVTFTEAAAAELRMRLRGGIGQALVSAGDAERPRLVQALGDLESAAIGTIHAFCVELLRLRPVEAGLDPSFGVADELTRRLLFAEVWDDWLRRHEIPDAAFEAALDLGFDGEQQLRQAAQALVEVPPEALPQAWFREADLLAGWDRAYSTARSGLRACDPKGALSRNFQEALLKLDAWRALPTREWQRKLIAEGLAVAKRAGKKEFEQRAIEAREVVNQELAVLRERLVHLRLCEFAGWLGGAGAAYRERAARRGLLDFDEQLRRARRLLLEVPAARAEFRRRYPVVMVDEFQDTDAVQTEIVLLLADPGEGADGDVRGLFLVGDPKQSIYRFRGADLESYNRLVLAEVPGERRLVLRQSFRPLPAIAEFVNAAMRLVMAPAPGREPAAYEAVYRELAAVPGGVEPRGGGVLHLELAPEPGAKAGDLRALEADALARFAHLAVEGRAVEVRDRESGGVRPARYGDVALLLSKMTELAAYEEAFHRYGVPFRVLGGRHYYRRDEVHALLEILRALADPGDAGAVVAALRGPGFGVADGDLLAFTLAEGRPRLDAVGGVRAERLAASADPAGASRAAAALAELRALRAAVLALPLADLVADVLERTGLLPYFALQPRGEQRVANLHKAIDVARRIEAAGRRDLQSFMRWMESLLEEEPEESDSPYLEGEGDTVRVTTVHRAKGLEYPLVLLGGLVGRGAPDVGLQVLRRGDGGVELRIPNGRGTLGWRAAQELEEARGVAEEKRLLYVALTRARDLLVLPFAPPESARHFAPLFRHLYGPGEAGPERHGTRTLRASELPEPPVAAAPPLFDLERLLEEHAAGADAGEVAARAAWQARPRATLRRDVVRPSGAGEERDLPAVAIAARARARRLGNAAHERIAVELGGRRAARETELSTEDRRRIDELVRGFLASDLAARARAAAPSERYVEVPVAARLDGDAVLDGQIDLAFLEDGAWVVVDHKHSRPEARDAERAEGYRRQLRLYAQALSRATGRPVREAWLFYLGAASAERVVLEEPGAPER